MWAEGKHTLPTDHRAKEMFHTESSRTLCSSYKSTQLQLTEIYTVLTLTRDLTLHHKHRARIQPGNWKPTESSRKIFKNNNNESRTAGLWRTISEESINSRFLYCQVFFYLCLWSWLKSAHSLSLSVGLSPPLSRSPPLSVSLSSLNNTLHKKRALMCHIQTLYSHTSSTVMY